MTHAEANRLLDAARAGAPLSTAAITQALHVTGDLPLAQPPILPVASFLNRGTRVMRGAGDVVAEVES